MFDRLICNLIGRVWLSKKYESWNKAKKNSIGYENSDILKKIKIIYRSKIKNLGHHQFYERDGVILKKKINDIKILNFLKSSKKKLKSLNVIDFGGSLGSVYFSNFNFLKKKVVKWSIVEQNHYVDAGKKLVENKKLKFYKSLEYCLKEEKPNIAIFSGSLQYIAQPYKILKKIKKSKIDYILLDKIPIKTNIDNDEFHIQYVPKSINSSSYPIRIFSEIYLKKFLKKNNFKITKINNISSPFFTIEYKSVIIKNEKYIL